MSYTLGQPPPTEDNIMDRDTPILYQDKDSEPSEVHSSVPTVDNARLVVDVESTFAKDVTNTYTRRKRPLDDFMIVERMKRERMQVPSIEADESLVVKSPPKKKRKLDIFIKVEGQSKRSTRSTTNAVKHTPNRSGRVRKELNELAELAKEKKAEKKRKAEEKKRKRQAKRILESVLLEQRCLRSATKSKKGKRKTPKRSKKSAKPQQIGDAVPKEKRVRKKYVPPTSGRVTRSYMKLFSCPNTSVMDIAMLSLDPVPCSSSNVKLEQNAMCFDDDTHVTPCHSRKQSKLEREIRNLLNFMDFPTSRNFQKRSASVKNFKVITSRKLSRRKKYKRKKRSSAIVSKVKKAPKEPKSVNSKEVKVKVEKVRVAPVKILTRNRSKPISAK